MPRKKEGIKFRPHIISSLAITIMALGGIYAHFANLFPVQADENPGTNISSEPELRSAWSDISGWWDFHNSHTVRIEGAALRGYALSSIGEISLDCSTTSEGNICQTRGNYGVCNGPGPHDPDGSCPAGNASGILTGYGWNDAIGWISFNCDQSDHGGENKCTESNYKVTINGTTGDFSGFAWNDIEGWISFSGVNHKVQTSWRATSSVGILKSAVFDTEVEGGGTLLSIIWQGAQPVNTSVDFQVAASNCPNGAPDAPECAGSGWQFRGPGEDPTTYYGSQCPYMGSSFPAAGPDKPICVDQSQTADKRFVRYRVRLVSDLARTQTPIIDDIILNWSQ